MRRSVLLASALLVSGGTLCGRVPLGAQETYVLVVAGLGGEDEWRERFTNWGVFFATAAASAGVDRERVIFLAEDPAAHAAIRGRSTAEEIRRAVAEIDAAAAPNDRVMIVLIGHGGSGVREDAHVSLPGADLRASDYRALLEELAPRTVALVNLASSSGDFIPVLAGENRVVVTATRSVQQRNAPLFGQFFSQAFVGSGSDLDRDGRVSVLEAFEFARLETDRYYRDRGLLVPETALLEDRPAGPGVHLPEEEEEVGFLASRFVLQGVGPIVAPSDPAVAAELTALYARQEALEVRIGELARARDTLGPEAYATALEPVLIELAEVGARIRALEGGGAG